MKRIASRVILLVLLLLLIATLTSCAQAALIEIPMGCNVPEERLNGFKESGLRGMRVDDDGTLWWGANYNGPSVHWSLISGPKTMCSPTGETIIIRTNYYGTN